MTGPVRVEYEVTWQMTGRAIVNAVDEVEVQSVIDMMRESDLAAISAIDKTQVLATHKVQEAPS